jgi:hypothetical protein
LFELLKTLVAMISETAKIANHPRIKFRTIDVEERDVPSNKNSIRGSRPAKEVTHPPNNMIKTASTLCLRGDKLTP